MSYTRVDLVVSFDLRSSTYDNSAAMIGICRISAVESYRYNRMV